MKYCKNLGDKNLTVSDVIDSKAGSIRLLIEKAGSVAVDAMIVMFITDLNNFLNTSRPMNSIQIAQTASIIIKEFPFFTPEDFSRCFYNIKAMKYGAIYEGLDGGKILSFMQKYEEEFMAERALINRKKVDDERENFNNEMQKTGELLLPVLKNVVEKLDKPKVITPKPEREKSENEKMMQAWFKEFDELHKKTNQPITESIRAVLIKGRWLTQEEFINMKLEELTTPI